MAARGNRDDIVLATKVGGGAARRGLRSETISARGRGLARAPADRPHRPLLRARRRPGDAARGDAARVRRAGPRGQGPPPRRVELHAPSGSPRRSTLQRERPRRVHRPAAALQPRRARLRGRPCARRRRGAGPRRRCRTTRWPRASSPASTARAATAVDVRRAPRAPAPTRRPRRGGARGARRGRGGARRRPLAAVALAWLRAQPTVVAPIASARTHGAARRAPAGGDARADARRARAAGGTPPRPWPERAPRFSPRSRPQHRGEPRPASGARSRTTSAR